VGYVPTPKIGCSTIKNAFYELAEGKPFDKGAMRQLGYEDVHAYFSQDEYFHRLEDVRGLAKSYLFCVVRDPVKRLISCYRDRVVLRQDLGKEKKTAPILRVLGLPREPDLNTFALNLRAYMFSNWLIRIHARNQTDFIGTDLNRYDRVFKLEEMAGVETMLRDYTDRPFSFGRLKSDGPKIALSELEEPAFEQLLRLYAKDYETLAPFYQREAIISEYRTAREGRKAPSASAGVQPACDTRA
jgi:hypothetical protein